MSTMLLRTLLDRAEKGPDLPILARKDSYGVVQVINQGRLIREIRSFADFFSTNGLLHSEIVAIAARRVSSWIAADCAIMALGAATVCLDPHNSPADMVEAITFCRSSFCLVEDESVLSALLPWFTRLPLVRHIIVLDPSYNPPPGDRSPGPQIHGITECFATDTFSLEKLPAPDLADCAAIILTKADQNEQRAVMVSHKSLTFQAEFLAKALGRPAGTLALVTLSPNDPLFRVVVVAGLLAGWMIACDTESDLPSRLPAVSAAILFASERMWELLARKTRQGGLQNSMLARMALGAARQMYRGEAQLRAKGSPLRWVVQGLRLVYDGLFIRPQRSKHLGLVRCGCCRGNLLSESARQILAAQGVQLLSIYASAESGLFAAAEPGFPEDYCCSLPETELEVRDQGGLPVSGRQPGRLFVRGNQVMKGYLRQPLKSREALDKAGWLATGLTAELSGTGKVAVFGRTQDSLRLVDGTLVDPLLLKSQLRLSRYIADLSLSIGKDGLLSFDIVVDAAAVAHRIKGRASELSTQEQLTLPRVQAIFRRELKELLSEHRTMAGLVNYHLTLTTG